MRKSKGKWIFSKRDVWSLDDTLSPIIHAGLVKFKEVVATSKHAGVPSLLPDQDFDEAFKQWMEILDKMIYAFDSSNEPDISKYDFTFKVSAEGDLFDTTNPEIYDAYIKDMNTHILKCQEGRKLFAEYYDNLWD